MKFSGLFDLNGQDFFKGMLMAVGGAVFTVVQSSLSEGIFMIDWTNVWQIALTAFAVYIGKNFFTPVPKMVEVDPAKTTVIDVDTKEVIAG